MYCGKCGKQSNNSSKFCGYCGEPFQIEKKYCAYCGKEVEASIKFCPYCGSKVLKDEQKVANNLKVNIPQIPNNNTQIPIQTKLSSIVKNKKIIIGICSVLIFLLIGIAFCQHFNSPKTRTVMIYMVGSNLETDTGLATSDLSKLDYQKTSDHKLKILLMAGGTTAWKNNYIDVTKTSIYEFTEKGFVEVDSREISNMGSSSTLNYFLDYVYKNYKSTKYDFIYWNHGGAVDGSEYDDIYADNLKLIDMKNAFETSQFKGKNKIEVLSFRTCLNSTLEVANIYKEHAEYLVASEEITRGAPIASALEFLNNVLPTDNAIEYGKKQIRNYQDTITTICNENFGGTGKENFCLDSTYSIVDLSKIDPINSSLDKFSGDLNRSINGNYHNAARLRANTSQYGGESVEYDMIDLYDWSKNFASFSQNNARRLQQTIKDAVIYNWSTNSYSHGLSIYFPYNADIFLGQYEEISPSKNYNQFVTTFNTLKKQSSSNTFSNFSSEKMDVKKSTKESADVEIQLTDEQVKNFAKASYYVFADNKDGYYNVLYRGDTVKIEGNTLKADVKGKLLRIADKEYLEDSEWIRGYEKESTDSYTDIIGFLVVSNHIYDSHLVNVEIRIDKKHPNGYIKNIYYDKESSKDSVNNFSATSPVNVSLKDYQVIESFSSAYKILDENGNYNDNWPDTSNGIIKGHYFATDQFTLVKEDFSSEYDYYVIVQIWDTSNKSYFSNVVKVGAEK